MFRFSYQRIYLLNVKITASRWVFNLHLILTNRSWFQDEEIASTADIGTVIKKFIDLVNNVESTLKLIQERSESYNKTNFEIQIKRQAMEAFSEAIKLFEDQAKLQEKFQKEAQPHEISRYVISLVSMTMPSLFFLYSVNTNFCYFAVWWITRNYWNKEGNAWRKAERNLTKVLSSKSFTTGLASVNSSSWNQNWCNLQSKRKST